MRQMYFKKTKKRQKRYSSIVSQSAHLILFRFVRDVVEAAGGQVLVSRGGTVCLNTPTLNSETPPFIRRGIKTGNRGGGGGG